MAVQGLCAALRQRRLPLHFRHQAAQHRERPQRARNGELVPPPDARGNPGGAAAADKSHYRATRRHRGIAVAPHGRRRPPGRSLPDPERARYPRAGESARPRQDRAGLIPPSLTSPPSGGGRRARQSAAGGGNLSSRIVGTGYAAAPPPQPSPASGRGSAAVQRATSPSPPE